MTTTHTKPKRGEPIDNPTLIKTGDSGWKTVKRVRQVETEYQGVSYYLRKRIEIPYAGNEDYFLKLEWGRNGEGIPSRNVPHQVIKFLTRVVDRD
jgi:hypothetical protein